ncbi:PREDICTED: uncharacterized protein LOC105557125 [Vollenhovia emeryi]|uniref:uncharacterized protein LOC105557125 n=1 Tax=Vollenhovia emeryi TaxID=411798 RepID=UPI0005F3832F|nr:PREDICTED: uncharacterized protein LOC105557125 [Vollenhovia emeryi]
MDDALQCGGFTLRKWAANNIALLSDIPTIDLAIDFSKEDSAILKVLGITWLPKEDSFSFQVGEIPKTRSTKRTILSLIARLFDPLGWASPVVIQAKMLMQDLWLAKVDWDDQVPQTIQENWEHYCRELPSLSKLRIPRWIVSLIAAKSKVAPLKTVAIPRLELNGIVLLVRLLEYVKETFEYDSIPVHGWTNSTVALAWLTQHPSRWKPYVANRVSEIQTKMPEIKWRHVPTRENPADCASRGITAQELIDHALWWSGPAWLRQNSAFCPNSRPCASSERIVDQNSVLNEQCATAIIHVAQEKEEWDFSSRFSNWNKLLRVTGLLFRWLRKFRTQKCDKAASHDVNFAKSVQDAREVWIRKIQNDSFAAEIRAVQAHASLPRSTALKSLNPFLERKGPVASWWVVAPFVLIV